MKEKLIVENFLGLNCEIVPNKFSLIIGPQSSGKSIIAKLFYFFRNIGNVVVHSIVSKKNLNSELERKFLQYFQISGKGKFRIKFENDKFSFIVSSSLKNKVKINISGSYQNYLKEIRNRFKNNDADRGIYFHINHTNRQIYIPAGRAFFASLQSNFFTLLSNSEENIIDPFLVEFGSYYERIKELETKNKRFFPLSEERRKVHDINEKKYDNMSTLLLKGEYSRQNGKDFIICNKAIIPLEFTSSGQQEVLPLILSLRKLLFSKATIYIEEPEAHLFPVFQKHMADLISFVFNVAKENQFLITTHSPYILTAFNNLIYAGRLEEKLNKRGFTKLNKIIPSELRLHSKDVSAFSLDGSGGISDVMDKETGLIKGDLIDNVSEDLADDFDKLLSLDRNK